MHYAVNDRAHYAVDDRAHYAVDDRAHYAVNDRAHYAVNDRAHDGRITLTLEEKYQLSLYEKVTRLSDDKQIWLVKNIETNEIYVRKELLLYNFEVYAQLKEKQFDNIPKVIECVEEENRLIVIEEYIHGKTLETVMEEHGVLSEENAAFVIRSLCDILHKLHGNLPPIIHRDIKPSNIIFSSDGVVKLIDFNAARELRAEQNEDTRLMGTRRFAAPEQYGFGQSDPRTDIYALGITFYYMLTGDYPDSGKYAGKYYDIITKCIQLAKEDRYPTVDELRKVIQECGTIAGSNKRTNDLYSELAPKRKLAAQNRFYSDALDFIKRIVQFALQPKSTDKQLALGWRRWLPVGFRTGKIWKMLIAALGYVIIYALCFSSTFTDADNAAYTGFTLWAFRIDALLMLLGCVELIGNYGGVMDRLPLMNKSRLLYMIMTVIYTIVWCFLIISILALVVS